MTSHQLKAADHCLLDPNPTRRLCL